MRVNFTGLKDLAPGKPVRVVLRHADGTKDEVTLIHSLTEPQIGWFQAGSALNLIRRGEPSWLAAPSRLAFDPSACAALDGHARIRAPWARTRCARP